MVALEGSGTGVAEQIPSEEMAANKIRMGDAAKDKLGNAGVIGSVLIPRTSRRCVECFVTPMRSRNTDG